MKRSEKRRVELVKRLIDGTVDLRSLSWFEMRQMLDRPNSVVSKLALLRQIAENLWRGDAYRNSVKAEVTHYLCGFLSGRGETDLASVIGAAYLNPDLCPTEVRKVQLTVFAFLDRCKLDGRTQGVVDVFRGRQPQSFLKEAEEIVKASGL